MPHEHPGHELINASQQRRVSVAVTQRMTVRWQTIARELSQVAISASREYEITL